MIFSIYTAKQFHGNKENKSQFYNSSLSRICDVPFNCTEAKMFDQLNQVLEVNPIKVSVDSVAVLSVS